VATSQRRVHSVIKHSAAKYILLAVRTSPLVTVAKAILPKASACTTSTLNFSQRKLIAL
jgi:hypothetical protein